MNQIYVIYKNSNLQHTHKHAYRLKLKEQKKYTMVTLVKKKKKGWSIHIKDRADYRAK